MSESEVKNFLQTPRHAIVGTNALDGAPHLSPVWYLYEDDRLYIGITTDTIKYRNLRRDPRISLCIDGGHGDARTVMFYGVAELFDKAHPLQKEMRWRLISRYIFDTEEAHRYAETSQKWDSVLIVVTLQKVISQKFT